MEGKLRYPPAIPTHYPMNWDKTDLPATLTPNPSYTTSRFMYFETLGCWEDVCGCGGDPSVYPYKHRCASDLGTAFSLEGSPECRSRYASVESEDPLVFAFAKIKAKQRLSLGLKANLELTHNAKYTNAKCATTGALRSPDTPSPPSPFPPGELRTERKTQKRPSKRRLLQKATPNSEQRRKQLHPSSHLKPKLKSKPKPKLLSPWSATEVPFDSSLIPYAKTYRPTWSEFRDFHAYLRKISKEASRFGIVKIIPPHEFEKPKLRLKDLPPTFSFSKQIPHDRSRVGAQVSNVPKCNSESVGIDEYASLTETDKQRLIQPWPRGPFWDPKAVESRYWRWLSTPSALPNSVPYASDIDYSVFQKQTDNQANNQADKQANTPTNPSFEVSDWNLSNLAGLPKGLMRHVKKQLGREVPGVTRPFLYIGSKFSSFSWHVEDNLLYSISYHHGGAPKTWYGVPSHEYSSFERAEKRLLPAQAARGGLRRKTSMVNPIALKEEGVPISRLVQTEGEFVITFPRAYHSGFNHGLNCAEAVNFADGYWLGSFGAIASEIDRKNHIPPVLSFDHLALASFESDSDRTADASKQAIKAKRWVRAREMAARAAFKKRFANQVSRRTKRPWYECALAYCDECKRYLYLSAVEERGGDSMFCLRCVVESPGLITTREAMVLSEHVTDKELRKMGEDM